MDQAMEIDAYDYHRELVYRCTRRAQKYTVEQWTPFEDYMAGRVDEDARAKNQKQGLFLWGFLHYARCKRRYSRKLTK